jgi:hypothetical protein
MAALPQSDFQPQRQQVGRGWAAVEHLIQFLFKGCCRMLLA